jgi:hypothetical protein
MTEKKTSEAQLRATKKYQATMDKDKKRYQSYKGTARLFIKKYVTIEDLEELKQLIKEREAVLKG